MFKYWKSKIDKKIFFFRENIVKLLVFNLQIKEKHVHLKDNFFYLNILLLYTPCGVFCQFLNFETKIDKR